MVGKPWSWKGAFSPEIYQNLSGFLIRPIFRPKNLRINRIWPNFFAERETQR